MHKILCNRYYLKIYKISKKASFKRINIININFSFNQFKHVLPGIVLFNNARKRFN